VAPLVGRDYPASYAELRAWFPDDAACLDYLDWLRWPDGFVCPRCGDLRGWRTGDGRWSCGGCARRVSVTAGTIFHGTRTPLTVWFVAAWQLTSQKNGVSALGLQRVLGLGSYQTAWAMLHKYRAAMVRAGRERLQGRVEVDETYLGGDEPGRPGRGALGKVLVAVAVEQRAPKGFGRTRLSVIASAAAPELRAFLLDNVEPGAVVITDGWRSYPPAIDGDYTHEPRPVAGSGDPAHVLLPGVHLVASLVKRWLLGTLQGAVEADHMQAYLNEFAFRFNRRRSGHRGLLFHRLLEQAVHAEPVRYRDLVANPRPGWARDTPPRRDRSWPASLDTPALDRPWRRGR